MTQTNRITPRLTLLTLILCIFSILAVAFTQPLKGVCSSDHFNLPRPPKWTGRKLLHFVWSHRPFASFFLASLDSALRASPDVSIKIHFLLPEGTEEPLRQFVSETLEWQLAPLREIVSNLSLVGDQSSIELLLRDDLEEIFKISGLYDSGIRQRHLGGIAISDTTHQLEVWRQLVKAPSGPGFLPGNALEVSKTIINASAIMRLIILWVYGGLAMSSDVWLLADLPGFLSAFGSLAVSEGQSAGLSAVLGFTPGHAIISHSLKKLRDAISKYGIGGILPTAGPALDSSDDVVDEILAEALRDWKALGLIKRNPAVHAHPAYFESTEPPNRPKWFHMISDIAARLSGPLPISRNWKRHTVNIFSRDQLGSHSADFLPGALTTAKAETIARGSAVRLRLPEAEFRRILHSNPNATISYIHRITCLSLCDTNRLFHKEGGAESLIRTD